MRLKREALSERSDTVASGSKFDNFDCMSKFYRSKQWQEFRSQVLDADDNRCCKCDRTKKGNVVLQVHHKRYVTGRKPWEYPLCDVQTLCRGCHGAVHRFWPPKTDWDYLFEMDRIGEGVECDLCGRELRYVHMVWHPDWGELEVGEGCAATLTQRGRQDNDDDETQRFETFRHRRHWDIQDRIAQRIHLGVLIQIIQRSDDRWCISMNGATSVLKSFSSCELAQRHAHDALLSGKADEWLSSCGLKGSPNVYRLHGVIAG